MDNLFSNIVESLPFGLLILEIQSDNQFILYFNEKMEKLNQDLFLTPFKKLELKKSINFQKNNIPNELGNTKLINLKISNILNRNIRDFSKLLIFVEIKAQNKNFNYDYTIEDKKVPIELSIIKIDEKDVCLIFNPIKNVSEKNKEDYSKLIVNSISNGALLLSNDKIQYVNSFFVKLLKYNKRTALIGKKIENIVHPSEIDTFYDDLINSDKEKIVKFLSKDGEIVYLNIFGGKILKNNNNVDYLINAVNVTDKIESELALLQTHRMASVGELTAGIAHEINNPLFGIINYASLIKDTLDQGKPITKESEEYEFITGISDEADRISKIIGNLSEFSVKAENKQYNPTDIKEIIQKVEKLLAYQIRHTHIHIEKLIPKNFEKVNLQTYRIEHAIFNLLLNSIQALQKVKNRKRIIKIKVEKIIINKNEQLKLIIEDNGIGISAKNLVKVFGPFFTTNRPGKSTGLGLYTVYNIIQDHNGEIRVFSEENKWTRFEVSIPIKNKIN